MKCAPKFLTAVIFSVLTLAACPLRAADPLLSWNDTETKNSIIDFVEQVATEGSPDFVPTEERIATFDNDGTLWTEHSMYTQLAFTLDRVKTLASA